MSPRTCVVVVLLATLAVLVDANSYLDVSNVNLTKLANAADAARMNGLEIWIQLASAFRKSIRTSQPITPDMYNAILAFINGSGSFPVNQFMTLAPIVAFVVINLIGFVCLLVFSPCICCCCIKRRKSTKAAQKPVSHSKHFKTKLTFAFIFLLQTIFCICQVSGNAAFSQGLQNIFQASNALVTSAQNTTVSLQPKALSLINSAGVAINASVDALTDPTPIVAAGQQLIPQLNSLVADLQALANGLPLLSANLTILSYNIGNLTSDINTLGTQINQTLDATSNLNAAQPFSAGRSYQLRTPITGIPSSSSFSLPDLSNIPDIQTVIQSLNNIPSLTPTLSSLRSLGPTLIQTLTNTIAGAGTTVKGMVGGPFASAQTAISSQLSASPSGPLGSASQMLGTASTYIASYSSLANQIDLVRYSVHLAIACFVLFMLIVVGLGMVSKSTAAPIGCAGIAVVVTAFLFLLSFIYVVLGLTLGEVCSQLDKTAPMQEVSLWTHTSDPTNYATLAYQLLDNCIQYHSLITSLQMTNLAVLGASTVNSVNNILNMVNISSQVNTAMAGVDVNGLVNSALGSFDVNQLLTSGNTPIDSQLSPLTTGLVASFNTTYFSALINSTGNINTSSLTQLSSSLTTLQNSVDTSYFQYTGIFTPSDESAAVSDFQTKIGNVLTSLNTIQTVTIPSVNNDIGNLTQTLASVIATTNALQASANQTIVDYTALANSLNSSLTSFRTLVLCFSGAADTAAHSQGRQVINVRVPQFLGNVTTAASNLQGGINTMLDCQPIASNTYATLNSVCVVFMGGLDAVWASWFLMALYGFQCIIIFVQIHRIVCELLEEGTAAQEVEKATKMGKTAHKNLGSQASDQGLLNVQKSASGVGDMAATPVSTAAELRNLASLVPGDSPSRKTSSASAAVRRGGDNIRKR
ncbi:hypothetical protein RI367_004809 [Sorochytrium milnesiophthora]